MRTTVAEYLRMTPAERRRVTELVDGKEQRRWRDPELDDAEEYRGEIKDRGHM